MPLYADSDFPVPDTIDGAHAAALDHLTAPGTWGSGTQRRAVAAEARRAGVDAGLLDAPAGGVEAPDIELPDAIRYIVRRIAVAPGKLTQQVHADARAAGLDDAGYAELVGVVSRAVDLDVFARGIGVAPRPLPAAKPGAPSRARQDAAVPERAWVATVPNFPEGGETARDLYGEAPKAYIVRGLSIVPDEMRAHLALEEAQYSRLDKVRDFSYCHHDALTRPQTEIVAGRISALNACFF
jgi:hypothetical protein